MTYLQLGIPDDLQRERNSAQGCAGIDGSDMYLRSNGGSGDRYALRDIISVNLRGYAIRYASMAGGRGIYGQAL